ncbi:MAG: hypothetical protein AUI14_21460 [Actinobacteria bacterium 13_2_20CM_2_71_6]|nr:MAG: hypothetical protein AUI14_21460 [Actinobacteria bacterium 13_2_20CM_2_71_6]
MTWPVAGTEPLSRLRILTQAVVLVRNEVTGQPPAVPPQMRVRRVDPAGAVELSWTPRSTLGGAVVFAGFDLAAAAGIAGGESYELLVDPTGVLRPERPDGYPFTIPVGPAQWPVQVSVVLLPGPGYPYRPQIPVVRGRVLRPGPPPVPVVDAVVAAVPVGPPGPPGPPGPVVARCLTDHAGRFSLGIARLRTGRALNLVATAPDGTSGAPRLLHPDDLRRTVDLTIP